MIDYDNTEEQKEAMQAYRDGFIDTDDLAELVGAEIYAHIFTPDTPLFDLSHEILHHT